MPKPGSTEAKLLSRMKIGNEKKEEVKEEIKEEPLTQAEQLKPDDEPLIADEPAPQTQPQPAQVPPTGTLPNNQFN